MALIARFATGLFNAALRTLLNRPVAQLAHRAIFVPIAFTIIDYSFTTACYDVYRPAKSTLPLIEGVAERLVEGDGGVSTLELGRDGVAVEVGVVMTSGTITYDLSFFFYYKFLNDNNTINYYG